jgi:hypothetical protein
MEVDQNDETRAYHGRLLGRGFALTGHQITFE